MAYILLQRAQKRHNLIENPLKMVKIYTKFGQNIHKLDTFEGFFKELEPFFDLKIVLCVTTI